MTIISIAHRLSTISKSENVIVLGKKGKVVEQGRFVELFSDPNSELSKLLDESSTQKKEDDERNDEQERLDKEAKEIEMRQRIQRGEIELVRSLIADLPYTSKTELVKQMEQELAEEEESYEKEELTSQAP